MIKASIIIPVFNKWELTRNCLKSIADNTDMANVEVLVVDNASTDQTPQGCPFLGRKLFGDHFRFIRNDSNRNFAGACNQGAEAARGEFAVFLNNDTEVQPSWLPPLLADFEEFPRLGATGPLLLYPEQTPYGRLIQHLGVCVSPAMKLGHLYAGIPAASALAARRRFFQVITAACMAMPRQLFLDTGKFDEGFVNGFEDVELCARLGQRNLRLTVNPASAVIHYESQTPGRHAHSAANSALLTQKTSHLLKPDWTEHVEEDGLLYILNAWRRYQVQLPPETWQELAPALETATPESIKELLLRHVFWQAGWEKAAALAANPQEKAAIMRICVKLFHNPHLAYRAYVAGEEARDRQLMDKSADLLMSYVNTPEAYRMSSRHDADMRARINSPVLLDSIERWEANFSHFTDTEYPLFAREYLDFAKRASQRLNPLNREAYALWRYGGVMAREKPVDAPGISFSILMPVHNPKPEFFRAAMDSILAQTHTEWELCLADDASTDAQTGALIHEYMARDARIKACFRQNNGHIAAATNSALELATRPWSLLMDQDDELAPDALASMAEAIAANPQGILFFSDEDKIDAKSSLCLPYFKSGKWDPELLAGQNYVCHLSAWRTDRLKSLGGLRADHDGAQDYELLLRYVSGASEDQLVHVPRVLYHWRMHEASTAMNSQAKPYALDNGRKACQAWLDESSPGAVCLQQPGYIWRRVKYPLPEKKHLVSIVSPTPLPAQISAPAGWPCEVLINADPNAGASAANGDILCFLARGVAPVSSDWLEELVSRLLQPHTGAVGGKITRSSGALLHGGYLTDASGLPKPLFAGAKEPRWFGWPRLARTVDALDGSCLLTRKKDFFALGGLDQTMASWGFQDYCLKLGQSGKKSVWWPFAEFSCGSLSAASSIPDTFRQKWQDKLEPFNPNLLIAAGGFALADKPFGIKQKLANNKENTCK